jgi:positive regulator of sigma E activity
LNSEREIDVPIPAGIALMSGDQVSLALSDSALLRATVFAYGFPLGGVIVALILAWLARGPMSDWVAVIAAGMGLAAGCYLGRRRLRASACLGHLQARIVQRHGASA